MDIFELAFLFHQPSHFPLHDLLLQLLLRELDAIFITL